MRRVSLLVLGVLALSCGGGQKQHRWRPGPGDDLPEPDRNVLVKRPEEEATAAGGFRVVAVSDPASRLIELGLRVRTGHIDDPPGKEGLAHLVEHLVFELRPGGPTTPSLGEQLNALATGVNATTEIEATHYTASAPRDIAPKVAAVLAEIPVHASCAYLDKRVFEREREVVRNELHLRANELQRTLLDALTRAAYANDHPYRRPMHTSASLDAITWKDVCDFLDAHYRPSEMFLVAGGGVLVTTTEMAPLLAPFDPIKVGEPRPEVSVPELAPVRAHVKIDAAVSDDMVIFVWPLPGRYTADGVAGMTIASWLGGALDGAKRDGRIGDSAAFVLGGARAPYMAIAVERGDDSVDAIQKVIVDVAHHLWDDVDRDHDYMVTQAAVRAVFTDLLDESGRTRAFADYTQFDSDGSLSSDVTRLEQLDRDALEALTRRLITADRASYVEVNATDPLAEKEPPLRNRIAELPAGTPVPDVESEMPFLAHLDVSTFTLDNGLEVVLAPSFFTPMMRATLVVPGGTADTDNPALPLYAGLALTPPDDGAGSYALAGNLLGTPLAAYDVSVGPFSTTFEVSALAGWQDVVVWGLANLVTSGSYDKDGVTRLVTRAKDALPKEGDRVEAHRRAVVQAELELTYGAAHPITRAPYVSSVNLGAIDVRALTAWHAAHHLPAGSRLVITGQFSPGLLTKHIKEAFARWTGGEKPSIPAAAPSETARRIAVIDDDKTHVTFELRIPTNVGKVDAEAAALVAAELLDERVQSVRDRLGAAYAIDATVAHGLGAAVVIAGQVDGAYAKDVFALVATAIADVRKGTFTDADLQRAQRRAARTLRARLATADTASVFWRVRGHDLDHGASLVKALDAVEGDAGRKAVSLAVAHAEQVLLGGAKPAVTTAAAALGGPPDRTIE